MNRAVFIYIVRRLLWTIPVLLLATFLTFVLVKAMPGDPFTQNQYVRQNPALRDNLERKFGLDKPWYTQYFNYVKGLTRGDMGPSIQIQGQSVQETIGDALPASATLGALAFAFAMSVGTLVGVVSALRANTPVDYVLTLLSTLVFAIPLFVTATYWVAYLTRYSGWDDWWQRTGPILLLGLAIMPYFVRLVRASMLETMHSDFVVTARSKGLPWRRTVMRHMLRNSLIPVVTNAGPLFGFVITGSFITEYIMDVPGVASLFVDSLRNPQDLNVVLGTTVLLSTVVIVMNLVVDIAVGFLDPRIAHE